MTVVVDLDRPESWPARILEDVSPLLEAIVAERRAFLAFCKSDGHFLRSSPAQPATDEAHAIINREMADRQIRVFHATRLLDFEAMRREGMHPLTLQRQLTVLQEAMRAAGTPDAARIGERLSRAAATTTDYTMAGREGQVWFTPLRRSLHDGGCDELFGYWGGEALRHLFQIADARLLPLLQSLGSPAVVVAYIPAFGCCQFGDRRLAPTMVGLMLERAGLIEYSSESWDVLIEQTVPPEWIEAVLPPDNPELAT